MTRPTVLAILMTPAIFAQMYYPCKCTQKPAYSSSHLAFGSTTALANQVAVATMWASGSGSMMANQDLAIYNITNNGSATVNKNWATDPYYSDARWNYQNLGDVFGLTLDDGGNIYLAATTLYSTHRTGSLANPQWYAATGDHGQIYKIDNLSGTPSAFFQLPNPHGAGLGNITYDCQHQSNFYVANLDDGLIYQLGRNKFSKMSILGTWDHGQNLASAVDRFGNNLNRPAVAPIANQPAQLGRRPFAVRVFLNRLYYSIWNMDGTHPSTTPNEIWSVAISSTGVVSGPARLELTMPLLNANTAPWNNPVTDITFTSSGSLLAAERTINTVAFGQSRVLEFSLVPDSQTQVHFVPATTKYSVGCLVGAGGNYANAAGGVDVDFTQPTYPVWATSIRMHQNNTVDKDWLDGLQGFSYSGGATSNSYLIDLDGVTAASSLFADAQPGDVKIPCPPAPIPAGCVSVNGQVSCM